MKTSLLLWIVLLPLLGAAANGALLLVGRPLSRLASGLLASAVSVATFGLSLGAFWQLQGLAASLPQLHTHVSTWIQAGSFTVDIAFVLDPLSALMVLIITGVGSLIHVYSLGYMKDDPDCPRYFSYLNLFLFAMLVLVLGSGPLVMFIGWEGVGLASYLLIGFWFQDAEKAQAGLKAFVVNRIGDLGFLVGIFVIFWSLYPYLQPGESLSFATIGKYIDVLQQSQVLGLSALELAGVCLFVGAIGKSAQIPLYVWLPDAMAGPTPVSALIHAATMVTAGVYMVARLNPLYAAAPTASALIAGVGAVTALFAASIATVQHDIKKILAYSTVSQLGFMFIGVGVGAYSAGVFHLMTHAFFKALLFLGAGSVIVGMHHVQDIRKMGGLLRPMKWTGFTFLVGTLAIIGFPGSSGFFSKDEILWKALTTHHTAIWVMGSLAAVLTAFYMTRLFCLTFLGAHRSTSHAPSSTPPSAPHESSPWMTAPLVILALLSAAGGLVGLPYFLTHKHPILERWLAPVFEKSLLTHPHGKALLGQAHGSAWLGEGLAMGVAVLGMLLGMGAALWLYLGTRRSQRALDVEASWQQPHVGGWPGLTYRTLRHGYHVDDAYDAVVVEPVHQLSRDGLWPFDVVVVDGVVNLMGRIARWCGRFFSWLHTGNPRRTLTLMAIGLISLLLWLMLTHSVP